ncbi:MAG TPA: type 4a pilus biogenesis protein PilO [Anaeromyxobacteraceae bacterium]|nr:type 4a pilus biogenesis protein PilO [Anaeromyxobacteraceae bacterium]
MEKLIERIAKAPLGLRVGVVAAVAVVVTALNYFVVGLPTFGRSISDYEQRIARVDREQKKLNDDLIDKTSIANNLNQFRREKELLEQRLAEALSELPEEKKVDELLQLFQDRATKAGLEISTIEPQAPVTEGFYARLPIPMTVTGNFHEIATFFDSLGRLRRIVNVNNITLDSPKDVGGKVILNGKFLVTAFMFVEPKAKAGPPGQPGRPAPPAKGGAK